MNEMPDRIGAYELDSEIGRGGLGVVYRATDSSLNLTVAIKALPTSLRRHEGTAKAQWSL